MRGQALERLGQPQLGLESLAAAKRLSGGNSKPVSLRGFILGRLGRTVEAREVLRDLHDLGRTRYVPPYAAALVHAGPDERPSAIEHLARAVEARDVHMVFATVDPKWDEYRDDPGFRRMLGRCRFFDPGG